MEAIFSSETSVDSLRTTRRYIQEYGTLHNHRCENLKPYIYGIVSHFIFAFRYFILIIYDV
jgi:hypothetical protein